MQSMRSVAVFATLAVSLAGCGLLQSRPHLAQVVPPAQLPERLVFRLVWPVADGKMAIVGTRAEGHIGAPLDQGLGVAFSFVATEPGVQALLIALANHGREAVVVPWHLVSLTGPDNVSRRVTRPHDPRAERAAEIGPTRIPPGGAFEDYVFPVEFITDVSDPPGGRRYAPFFERVQDGETVVLYLPLRIGGQVTSHTFRFVASVERR
jgi:hypothetical protein